MLLDEGAFTQKISRFLPPISRTDIRKTLCKDLFTRSRGDFEAAVRDYTANYWQYVELLEESALKELYFGIPSTFETWNDTWLLHPVKFSQGELVDVLFEAHAWFPAVIQKDVLVKGLSNHTCIPVLCEGWSIDTNRSFKSVSVRQLKLRGVMSSHYLKIARCPIFDEPYFDDQLRQPLAYRDFTSWCTNPTGKNELPLGSFELDVVTPYTSSSPWFYESCILAPSPPLKPGMDLAAHLYFEGQKFDIFQFWTTHYLDTGLDLQVYVRRGFEKSQSSQAPSHIPPRVSTIHLRSKSGHLCRDAFLDTSFAKKLALSQEIGGVCDNPNALFRIRHNEIFDNEKMTKETLLKIQESTLTLEKKVVDWYAGWRSRDEIGLSEEGHEPDYSAFPEWDPSTVEWYPEAPVNFEKAPTKSNPSRRHLNSPLYHVTRLPQPETSYNDFKDRFLSNIGALNVYRVRLSFTLSDLSDNSARANKLSQLPLNKLMRLLYPTHQGLLEQIINSKRPLPPSLAWPTPWTPQTLLSALNQNAAGMCQAHWNTDLFFAETASSQTAATHSYIMEAMGNINKQVKETHYRHLLNEDRKLASNPTFALIASNDPRDFPPPSLIPEGLTIALHDYQWHAFKQACRMEEGVDRNAALPFLHTPLWHVFSTPQGGHKFQYSAYLQRFLFQPPSPIRGGWLTMDLGLGKTIVALALIHAHPPSHPGLQRPDVMPPKHLICSKTTLIVVPVSLLPQWESELREKSTRPLSILSYYGKNRGPFEPNQYDVILTSYQVLMQGYQQMKNVQRIDWTSYPWQFQGIESPKYKSPLHKLHFHRIVLDESHTIRNDSSSTSAAVQHLSSDRKWMLSGTPFISNILDYEYMARFLQIRGVTTDRVRKEMEHTLVTPNYSARPVPHARPNPHAIRLPGEARLRLANMMLALCKQYMIRFEKNQPYNGRPILLQLPQSSIEHLKFSLSPSQQHIYDLMLAHAKARFIRFKDQGVAVSRCIECVQMLLPLRQAASFAKLVEAELVQSMQEENQQDLSRFQEDTARIVLQTDTFDYNQLPYASMPSFQTLDSDCAICLENLQEPIQATCRHMFCSICMKAYLNTIRSKSCPLCRRPIQATELCRPFLINPANAQRKTSPLKKKRKADHLDNGKAMEDQEPTGNIPMDLADDDDADEIAPSAGVSSLPTPRTTQSTAVVFDAKIKYLVEWLLAQRNENGNPEKYLVFAQFVLSIQALKKAFIANHIPFAAIEGSMSMPIRRKNLEQFQRNPACKVLLLTLRTGAVGLNLTNANHVFMFDACMNRALETQAIGRTLRIGQNSNVKVSRLMIKDSVEERIVEVMDIREAPNSFRDVQPFASPTATSIAAATTDTTTTPSQSLAREKELNIEFLNRLFGLDSGPHVLSYPVIM